MIVNGAPRNYVCGLPSRVEAGKPIQRFRIPSEPPESGIERSLNQEGVVSRQQAVGE